MLVDQTGAGRVLGVFLQVDGRGDPERQGHTATKPIRISEPTSPGARRRARGRREAWSGSRVLAPEDRPGRSYHVDTSSAKRIARDKSKASSSATGNETASRYPVDLPREGELDGRSGSPRPGCCHQKPPNPPDVTARSHIQRERDHEQEQPHEEEARRQAPRRRLRVGPVGERGHRAGHGLPRSEKVKVVDPPCRPRRSRQPSFRLSPWRARGSVRRRSRRRRRGTRHGAGGPPPRSDPICGFPEVAGDRAHRVLGDGRDQRHGQDTDTDARGHEREDTRRPEEALHDGGWSTASAKKPRTTLGMLASISRVGLSARRARGLAYSER